MAKRAKKLVDPDGNAPFAAAPANPDADASFEKAKRWARRGDAPMAAQEFRRFERTPTQFHELVALHPDLHILLR